MKAKIEPGDLVIIQKTGTIGFVTNVSSNGDLAIHILKRGTSDKTAWYHYKEATVLVPMSQSFENAKKLLSSPLYKALT